MNDDAAMAPPRKIAMPWLVIIGLLLLWQAVVVFDIAAFILPSPAASGSVSGLSRADHGPRPVHAHEHADRLRASALCRRVSRHLIGSSRLVYAGLYPLLIGINSVPKAAVVPILVIWMGIGTPPAIATAFLLRSFRSQ